MSESRAIDLYGCYAVEDQHNSSCTNPIHDSFASSSLQQARKTDPRERGERKESTLNRVQGSKTVTGMSVWFMSRLKNLN